MYQLYPGFSVADTWVADWYRKRKRGANLLHHANYNYTVLVTDLTDAYFALAFAWANPAMDFVIIASLVLSYSPLRYHHNCVDSVMCFYSYLHCWCIYVHCSALWWELVPTPLHLERDGDKVLGLKSLLVSVYLVLKGCFVLAYLLTRQINTWSHSDHGGRRSWISQLVFYDWVYPLRWLSFILW